MRRPPLRSLAETLVVMASSVALGIFGYIQGGQVDGTDSLLYLDAGLRGVGHSVILNRYTHVFLLSLATRGAATPLDGLRIFSGVCTALCTGSVYVCARLLRAESGPLNGVAAAAAFLSMPLTLGLLLAPQVDTTAMLAVLVLLAIYLLSSKVEHRSRGWLILLGAVLFLAFKGKETTVCASVLLVGLGAGPDGSFSLLRLWMRTRWVACGLVVGIGATVLINSLLMADPFFGLRMLEVQAFAARADVTTSVLSFASNWYEVFVFPQIGVVFMMYVVAGILDARQHPWHRIVAWLIPLALVVFLSLTLMRSAWGVEPRYFGPALGVTAVLAGQLGGLRAADPARGRRQWMVLGMVAMALGVVGLVGLALRSRVMFPSFYVAVMSPVVFSLLAGVLFFTATERAGALAAMMLCVLTLTIYPARMNLLRAAEVPVDRRQNSRFLMFEEFREEMKLTAQSMLFVSTSLDRSLQIGENREELAALVNVVYDLTSTKENYVLRAVDESFLDELSQGKYDFALVSKDDWDVVREGQPDDAAWRRLYVWRPASVGRIILIMRAQ